MPKGKLSTSHLGRIPGFADQMPRFFFHLKDRNGETADLEGLELPGAETAVWQCRKAVREILEQEKEFRADRPDRRAFHIVDESGRTFTIVSFEEILGGHCS